MPWTFAHPAAILPLRNIGGVRLPLAALVIGSLSPDFGYYLGQFELATFAHTLLGVLLLCLPTGALMLSLFTVVQHDLIRLLPQPHRDALLLSQPGHQPASRFGRLIGALAGLLLGAATHVLWDSFTHASGLAVNLLPALQATVLTVGSRQMHVYNLLQHASTALGLLAMLLVYRRWLGQSPPPIKKDPSHERDRYIVLAGCLVLACISGMLLAAITGGSGHAGASLDLFRVVILSTDAFAVLLLVTAVVWRKRSDA